MSRRRAQDARLDALLQASHAVAASLDLDQVLRTIVEAAAAISGAPYVRLFLLEGEPPMLHWQVGVGLPPEAEPNRPIQAGESFSGQVAASGQPLAVADCRHDPRIRFPEHVERYSLISYLGLPVKSIERVLGVLVFNTPDPREYTQEEIAYLAAFAQQAAVAVENARLHEATVARLEHVSILNRLTRSLMTLDPEAVYQEVIAAVRVLMPGAAARLWNISEQDQGTLELMASEGLQDERGGTVQFRRGEGLAGIAASTRQAVVSHDLAQDPLFVNKAWAAREGLVSGALFPLVAGERIHGILAVFAREPHAFSDQEVDVFQNLAAHAALAIENARLFKQEQERQEQLEAVRAVGEEITRELDLPRLLRLLIARAAALVRAASGTVYLVEGDRVVPAAWHGLGEWQGGIQHPLGQGVAGTVAQTRQGLVANDYRTSRYANPISLRHTQTTASLGEPLLYRDEVIGAITLNHEGGRTFTPEDQELVRLFATQAAIGIENARLFQAEQQRRQELEAVRGVAEEITRELDLRRVLALIAQRAVDLVGGDADSLWLWDEATQLLVAGAWHGHGDWMTGRRLRPGEGVAGTVALRRESLLINDYPGSPYSVPVVLANSAITACMGAPLIFRDRLLGALVLDRWVGRPPFTPADQHTLRLFATQAAIAVENARVHDAAVRRTAEREALLAAARSVMSGLDLPSILDRIVEQAQQISGAPHVKVVLVDRAANALRVGAARGSGQVPGELMPLDRGASGIVAQTGHILFSPHHQTDPRNLYADRDRELGLVTYLGLPIKRGEEVLGVLTFNTTTPREYSTEELTYLTAFAPHAAVAIENARLYEAGQQELAERRRAEATLVRYRLLAEHARDIVLFVEWATGRILEANAAAAAAYGYPPEELLRLSIQDLRSPETRPLTAEQMAQADAEGILFEAVHRRKDGTPFPVEVSSRGMDLDGRRVLLSVIRDIAARKQAEAALQQRTRQLEAIRSVSEEVTRELDLAIVLNLVVERAVALVGAKFGSIRLWDNQRQVLTSAARMGSDRHAPTVPLRLGEGVAGTAAQQRRGFVVNDLRASAYAIPALLQGTVHTAVIATPLLFGDRLVGTLTITRDETDPPFTDADLEVLNLFAPHAAVAIENARLHAAALQRGEELGALLRAGRVVMDGLNLDETLDRIIREASAIARAPHVKILLADTEDGTLRLAAVLGRPAEMMGQFDYAGRGSLSGVVAKTGHPLFVPDCQHDPRNIAAEQDSLLGIQTYLGLPIKSRGEILGVLTFNTTEPRQYTPGEIEYLSSFADQAAIAIENARLYEEVQRHAGELETRVKERTAELEEALRVKAEFLAKVSHELRTPLNFVLGFSDLLREQIAGPLTDKQLRFVDRIQFGGRQLLTLISDLLELSQVETGQEELRLERFLLVPVLQEVVEVYAVQAAQKQLQVETECPQGLSVVADRRRLIQILGNLVSNSVKFTPDGGRITVTSRQVTEDRRPETGATPGHPSPVPGVELAVADTGIGIAPGDLERIFLGFEQADGSSTRHYEGAGIGLALVRTLVNLHGGQVWAESAGLGQGSRFVVQLPVLAVPAAQRILVVEDEASVARLLAIFLRDAGYAVEVAETGGRRSRNWPHSPPTSSF